MGRDKPRGRHPNAKVASPNPFIHDNLDTSGYDNIASEDVGEKASTQGQEHASKSRFTERPQPDGKDHQSQRAPMLVSRQPLPHGIAQNGESPKCHQLQPATTAQLLLDNGSPLRRINNQSKVVDGNEKKRQRTAKSTLLNLHSPTNPIQPTNANAPQS